MPNIVEAQLATNNARITDKTDINSISPSDVGLSMNESLAIAALVPLADILRTYPSSFIVRNVSFDLFISINAEGTSVYGDVTNTSNWKPLGAGSASKQVFAQDAVNFADEYLVTDPTMTSYATDKLIIATPDTPNATTTPTYKVGSLDDLPIKKFSSGSYVDLAVGDFDGTVILLFKTTFFLLYQSSGGGSGGGGSEITNGTKQTALQLNSNWGTTEDYTPVMQSNTSTVLTGQSEHDYFYGTDSVTASIYKYEIIKIATVLSVIRIPLKY